MIRILVFSDTHGKIDLCKQAIKNIPCDLILHAGDINRDVRTLIKEFPDKEIHFVQGNNDFYDSVAYDDVVEVGGKRIFLTHGHNYRVKYEADYRTLAAQAKRNNCDMAVFGHTHTEYEGETNGIRLLNPGSARFGKTYGIIEIEGEKIKTCII
ncbi:MAG: metallophosphoesterase family protein [Candidatus Ornithomonoglobus sp.]